MAYFSPKVRFSFCFHQKVNLKKFECPSECKVIDMHLINKFKVQKTAYS